LTFFGCSALARVVDTIVHATTGSFRGVAVHAAFMYDTMGITTSSYCGVVCCDMVLGDTVDVTTSSYLGLAHHAAVMFDTVGVTTGSYCGVVFHDTFLGDTMDITTSSCLGVVCHNTFVLDGTMGITTGPFHCVIDTVGVTTGSCLAILRCSATILCLGGDLVGETTDSLGCIRLLYSPWRWAIMHCVGSMPWHLDLRRSS